MPSSVSPPVAADAIIAAAPAFETIYREHAQAIYYLTLRLLGNPAQAEDATHDVFLKAFRKYAAFRGDSSIRTWLYRIAINHCQTLRQSWHQRHVFTQSDDTDWFASPAATTLSSASPGPLRVLETKELGERIQKTFDALPPEYRIILLLAADEHLAYDQIATLTDQTPDAVRGKLHRARKAFAQHFSKTA
ncbi:sigma-70 family RNA polymerase sigma factor [Opitutaceae bacterium TAV4]|nr:sigma-70 family RNA polymerase sigma factor [Opitutaceae bacterium TAV4]RRJ98364.1 sigma-70 family RNA polymerase sigma factor [Opitutaceae bacterium TAV3]